MLRNLAWGCAFAAGAAVLLTGYVSPASASGSSPVAAPVIVRVTSVGVRNVQLRGDSLPRPIRFYATGTALIAIAGGPMVPLTDTIRLTHLRAFRADVTKGDVHVEIDPPAELELGATVTGGPATHVGATGSHIVLMQGGWGIRTLPRVTR